MFDNEFFSDFTQIETKPRVVNNDECVEMIGHQNISAQPCAAVASCSAKLNQARVNINVVQEWPTLVRACRNEINWQALKRGIESSKTFRHV